MSSLTPAAASDLFRQEPHSYIDVGEGEVALRTVGAGPDVLFVHGWPVSGATFRHLLPHLVDHVTCHIIDFPGAGSSRFAADTNISIDQHITTVGRVIDALGVDDIAVVGHDSGGMIARHAVAGDSRLRAMGLIDTEQPQGLSTRFKMFLFPSRLPGFKQGLGFVAGKKALRRNKFVLGDAFVDRSLLDGEFDEFFLRPLAEIPERLDAAMKVLRTFDAKYVKQLGDVHARIDVPVKMVWGSDDVFFPVDWAKDMVGTFTNADLDIIDGTGLFSHEERPAEVAAALLPTLRGD